MRQNKPSWCTSSILLGFHFQIMLILSYMSAKLVALDSNTDRESLLEFKSSVLDPRNALSGWNRSVSHCVWAGVSCSGRGSRVTSLDLPVLGLSGSLPPCLSNLTSLEQLNLFNNSFYGEIPTFFGNLSSVRSIILAGNSINGTIPGSLSLCRDLEQISFEGNRLSGSLPPELGDLRNLRILSISANNLTGEIPRSYGNLSALTTLSLAKNSISGELREELGALHNLTTLQISENKFTGELPFWLFNISSLEYISLTVNNLVGKLPSEMDSVNVTNLRELYLAHNRIGGTVPSFLLNHSKIRSLDLSNNLFEGRIPIPYNSNDLILLHLGYNNLSSTRETNGQFFDSLTNSTKLEILYLNSNFLSGELPRSTGNLSLHLRELCLDSNFLTGRFPDDGLERYQNLNALSIFQNSFSGNFPTTIGKASKLQRVQAHQNMFSGEIPGSFGNLSLLFMLTLGTNRFSGRIPRGMSGYKQMNILGLASNALSGNIPKDIFRLSTLGTLRLGNNKFTGPIPFEVGSLKQLEVLDIAGNYLSGSIPVSIGESLSLQSLNLARNNLSGSIPDSVDKLQGLESLDLSNNSITGTIPAGLGNLQILKTLNLSFNKLEGEVPQNGVFVNMTWEAIQGNGNLCASTHEVSQTLRISMCLVHKKSTNKRLLIAILVPVSLSILLLASAVLGLIRVLTKRAGRSEAYLSSSVKGLPMKISYEEIRRATSDFSPENFIGKGGFGSVYKGTFAGRVPADTSAVPRTSHTNLLGNGASAVAVKVIDLGQSKASESFITECNALKHVRHRNLVKVITSCSSVDHTGAEFKALVMEFMCNGNLDQWLYPEASECDGLNLGLMQRVSIAIDVASALEYLHSDCNPPVVHCDLKPGNVLLDEHMTARVGDFGLARLLVSRDQQDETESSTAGLKGSIGYIAPEYGMGGRASTGGDVYSFGILLLELFMAKKPAEGMFQGGLSLQNFATTVNENHHRVLQIVDPRLVLNCGTCSTGSRGDSSSFSSSGNTDQFSDEKSSWSERREECLVELITLGLSCATESPRDRPAMKEVLRRLHKVKGLLFGSMDPSPNPASV